MDRYWGQLTGWGTQSNGHVRWCNGPLVDLRDMPRELQEIAFGKGMIPYIPADRERSYAVTLYQNHLR
jgi:hypothetical protein